MEDRCREPNGARRGPGRDPNGDRERGCERPALEPEYRSSYPERVWRQRPFAYGVDRRDLPRAVVFRDSFSNALIPFLSENFERTLYVWDPDLLPEFVESERPDVVIQQIAERLIHRPPRGVEASRQGQATSE